MKHQPELTQAIYEFSDIYIQQITKSIWSPFHGMKSQAKSKSERWLQTPARDREAST